MRAAELGVQVLGGYGYLSEYRLEQTYRDARITAIYEGANGIHARMLATRLLKGPEAEAFEAFLTDEAERYGPEIVTVLEQWRVACDIVRSASDPSVLADDFMQVTTMALLRVLWARMAENADHHPEPERIARAAARNARWVKSFAAGYLSRMQEEAA